MTEAYEWCGRRVLGAEGEELGDVDEIYLDLTTGRFEWALVHTGPLGSPPHFVPLTGARPTAECVLVKVSKEQVMAAPIFERTSNLSQAEERRLFEHYGLPYDLDRAAWVDRRSVGMRVRTAVWEPR